MLYYGYITDISKKKKKKVVYSFQSVNFEKCEKKYIKSTIHRKL